MNGQMTIGVLSARTGVPVKAQREYTDLGLIHTRVAARPATASTATTHCGVRFIVELRGLGAHHRRDVPAHPVHGGRRRCVLGR